MSRADVPRSLFLSLAAGLPLYYNKTKDGGLFSLVGCVLGSVASVSGYWFFAPVCGLPQTGEAVRRRSVSQRASCKPPECASIRVALLLSCKKQQSAPPVDLASRVGALCAFLSRAAQRPFSSVYLALLPHACSTGYLASLHFTLACRISSMSSPQASAMRMQ